MFTLGSLAIAYLGAAAYLDRAGHRAPPDTEYDAIIVLGCRVRPDGTASLALARRARHGARLYREGLAPRLVLTGGVGDHPPSEARAAAVIAMEEGVPESAIVLEDASTSTDENAREAAARIDARRVLVVSDAYHTYRAARVFRRYFDHVDAVGSSGPRSVRVRGAIREVSAVAAYALLGRM
ncbi:MAG: YdcF family protein [Sandaracinaceae bacterium]